MANTTVRVGIFETAGGAERAVKELLKNGVREESISAISSNKDAIAQLGLHQKEPGTENAGLTAAAVGSAVGASAATVGAGATMLMLGAAATWVVGPFALLGGGVIGALVGAMTSRGIEEESADFYQSEVARGKILIAVKPDPSEEAVILPLAEKILSNAGAQPLELPRS